MKFTTVIKLQLLTVWSIGKGPGLVSELSSILADNLRLCTVHLSRHQSGTQLSPVQPTTNCYVISNPVLSRRVGVIQQKEFFLYHFQKELSIHCVLQDCPKILT